MTDTVPGSPAWLSTELAEITGQLRGYAIERTDRGLQLLADRVQYARTLIDPEGTAPVFTADPQPHRVGPWQCPILVKFAEDLATQPGMWVRWPKPLAKKSGPSTTRHVRLGTYRSLPPDLYEAKTVLGVVWVRYRLEENQ